MSKHTPTTKFIADAKARKVTGKDGKDYGYQIGLKFDGEANWRTVNALEVNSKWKVNMTDCQEVKKFGKKLDLDVPSEILEAIEAAGYTFGTSDAHVEVNAEEEVAA